MLTTLRREIVIYKDETKRSEGEKFGINEFTVQKINHMQLAPIEAGSQAMRNRNQD